MRQKKTRAFSWLLILVMVFSVISPGSVWNVNAEEAYDGYVYVTVERLTLGQGLADTPVKMGYYEEDTLEDILKRNLGEKMKYTESSWGAYLSGYADGGEPEGWNTDEIPAQIKEVLGESISEDSKRKEPEILTENDYVNYSGFTVAVDNVFPNVGISSVEYSADSEADTYHDGSVVRIQFSLYYGDLNITPSEYGEPIIEFANKDSLIKGVVDYTGDKENAAYIEAVAAIEDWDATETEVNSAFDNLKVVSLSSSYGDMHKTVVDYLKAQATEPSYGSEWTILTAARSGIRDAAWYKAYRDSVVNSLKNDEFDTSKSTEYSRTIIGLTSIGADASNVEGYDLTAPLADFDFVKKQGINGPVYALIALDCGGYEIPEAGEDKTQTTRELLISEILGRAVENGGWTFFGTVADPDMTGMAIQALAPYYSSNEEVKAAVDKALGGLSGMQEEDGGFASWGTVNSESCAQVVCALSALGIDADTDSRFVKNGKSVLDAMLSFYDESTGAFKHVAGGTANGMASCQAGYALAAYNRLKNNQKGLYDMSDADCLYICKEGEHSWDEGRIIKEPTTTEEGKKLYTCTICGETKEQSIPKKEEVKNEQPIVQQPTIQQPAAEQPVTGQPEVGNTAPEGTSQTISVKKVTSPKKKQIKVTWKKIDNVTGYQIQVSTSSKFKQAKTKTYKINKQKTTSKVIKALKSKKQYYVRIRTYTTTKKNGKKVTVYSKWSAKKTVKVK